MTMSKPLLFAAFGDAQPVGSFVVHITADVFTPSPLAEASNIFYVDDPASDGASDDVTTFVDPVEAAFIAGREEGMRLAAQHMDDERRALANMLEQLPGLVPSPTDALAKVLAEVTERLVRDIVGTVSIDPAFLAERAEKMAMLVGQTVEPVRLHIHPDDAELVRAACPDLTLVSDRTRLRGSLLLETGHGWFEDGPEQRLAGLRTELGKMGCGA